MWRMGMFAARFAVFVRRARVLPSALVMQTRNFRYRYLFKKIDLFLSGIVHFKTKYREAFFIFITLFFIFLL